MEIAQGIQQAVRDSRVTGKPVTVSLVGGERCDTAMRWLVITAFPRIGAPGRAVNAMAALREYAHMREILSSTD